MRTENDTEDDTETKTAVARRGPARRWLGRLGALVGGAISLGLGGVVVALCLVVDPPAELMRRSALPIVRQALNHDNVQIGALELDPLRKVEIRDLWIGPPKGYRLPLLSVRRITAEYDISEAGGGRIRVKRVEVERPLVWVEAKGGKLNWIAFIESLPPSPPKPEEPPGDPPEITVDVDRAAILDFGAYFDDGAQRAVLDGFNVTVSGRYAPSGGAFDVRLGLRQRQAGKPNLALRQAAAGVVAKLRTLLKLRVKLERLIPAKARLDVDLDVASQQLTRRAPAAAGAVTAAVTTLPPVRLRTLLSATFDQERGRAGLERLEVRFNRHQLLDLKGQARDVLGPRAEVAATLNKLSLPLGLFAPYLEALRPGIAMGGRIEVDRLRVATRLDRPAQPRLLAGRLTLSEIAARVSHAAAGEPGKPGDLARVSGIEGRIDFLASQARRKVPLSPARILAGLAALAAASGSAAEGKPAEGKPAEGKPAEGKPAAAAEPFAPDLAAHGSLSIGSARAAGARLDRLRLRFAGGAERDPAAAGRLATAAGRLDLRLARASRRQPGLGRLTTSLGLELAGGADLRAKTAFSLDRLRLVVDRLVRLRLSGRLDGGLDQGRYRARLELEPLDLAGALRRVPRPIRAKLAGLVAGGKVGLELEARGILPRLGPRAPLQRALAAGGPPGLLRAYFCSARSPLQASRLGASLKLKGIKLRRAATRAREGVAAAPGINLQGLDGALKLEARQGLLSLGGKLGLGSLRAAGATVTRVELPVSLRLDPSRLSLELGLSAAGLRQGGNAVAGARAKATVSLSPSAPLLAQPISPARRFALALGLDLSAVRVRLRQAGLRLEGLSLAESLRADLPLGRLIAGRPPALPPLDLSLRLGAKKVAASLPGQKVDLSDLGAKVVLSHVPGKAHPLGLAVTARLARLSHRQLGLRASGLRLALRTAAGGVPLGRLPPPPGALALPRLYTEPITLEVDLASLRQRGALDQPLRDNRVRLRARLVRGGRVELAQLQLRAPSRGVRVDLSGSVAELPPDLPARLPRFDLRIGAALDTPRTRVPANATLVVPGLKVSGKVGLVLRARRSAARRVRVSGRLIADRFDLWQRATGVVERPEGGFLRTVTRLRLRNLNADVPFFQDLDLGRGGRVVLPPPKRSIFAKGARSGLYEALRPYSSRRATLALDGVRLEQRLTALTQGGQLINTRRRGTRLGKLVLDLAVGDSTLALDRFYLDVFGGDIAGSVNAQLVSLAPLDARLALRLQLTGIDLKRLDPQWTPGSAADEISTLLELKYGARRRELDGRIDITQISLKQLDGLLAFLDPNKVNESVKRNRKLLAAWYMKLARIKLVSIWIAHSNLNIDIDVATPTYFPAETLLRFVLKNNRIRRLNIRPMLPKVQ